MLLGEIIRYSSTQMLKEASKALGSILANCSGKFRNDRIEYKCIKNFVRCITKLI